MRQPTVAFFDTKSYDREFFGDDSVDWRFHEFRLSMDTVVIADGCDAVCIFVNDCANAEVIAALAERGVKLIALRCAGFNNVDIDAAKLHGIDVVRVPAYSPHAVAEHTVALLLTLNRKIHRAWNRVREHNFSLQNLVGFDLHGKTAGIIGTGKIGRETAQIFRGFGMTVIAHDPYPAESWATDNGVEYHSLGHVLQQSDVISLHVPLMPETVHIINQDTLALMKPNAVLINTSRGKLIDTKALINALKLRALGGVALDVYEEEEGVFFEDLSGDILPDDVLARLLTFPNVLITSHQGFLTKEALSEIARVTTENILILNQKKTFAEGTVVVSN